VIEVTDQSMKEVTTDPQFVVVKIFPYSHQTRIQGKAYGTAV